MKKLIITILAISILPQIEYTSQRSEGYQCGLVTAPKEATNAIENLCAEFLGDFHQR